MKLKATSCSRIMLIGSSSQESKYKTQGFERSLLVFSIILIIFAHLILHTNCIGASNVFKDESELKPSIVLIVPQSFRVSSGNEGSSVNQNFVAIINNIHNDQQDQLLRSKYKQLVLQVRDAAEPIVGRLIYEQIFDYFPDDSTKQHILLPINLDHISQPDRSQSHNQLNDINQLEKRALATSLSVRQPQQLIVSIRPSKPNFGFASDTIELVSSAPIPIDSIHSKDGKRSFGFIQTDKPIYKPTDKVKIRCMIINEDLKPVINEEFRLQIKNPRKDIVEQVRFPRQGDVISQSQNNNYKDDGKIYLDYVFEFPPEPIQGLWSAQLQHRDQVANDTVSFEVKEYVLPTFEVEFDTPDHVLPNDQSISGHIVAKYHYGKPVQGKVHFKFGFQETPRSTIKWVARSHIKTIDPETGRVDFKIGTDKIIAFEWFPTIAGYKFVVEATVTETSTGHREVIQDTKAVFISLPYIVSFEDSIEDFRPGMSQQLVVQVIDAQTQGTTPENLKVVAKYRDQKGSILNNTNVWLVQQVHSIDPLQTEAFTDKNGRATFNIGPIREDISSIEITMTVFNSTRSIQQPPIALAENRHTLVRHNSDNGWILLMNKTLSDISVGQQFESDLLIRDAIVIPQKVFYIVVSRGQLLLMDVLSLDGIVRFTITEQMVPSIRIILFAMTHDSVGLLSDSMRLNVVNNLSCGLNVSFKPQDSSGSVNNSENRYKPDTKGKLVIQARQGDSVSLMGVDSAVYTLSKRGKIESKRVIERIKRLDAGCGFGGGRDNLDVFLNAGLMLFRDSNLSLKSTHRGSSIQVGSFCLSVHRQLRRLEDVQLGYHRPNLAVQSNQRPRALDTAIAVGHRIADTLGIGRASRSKRSSDIESILARYKDPMNRACCRLGTFDDYPQRRNCTVRSNIVDKYMRPVDFAACSQIYLDCCLSVFGNQLALGSFLGSGDIELTIRSDHVNPLQAPMYSEANIINAGHLERIEAQTFVRKDFRETWLFDVVDVNDPNGQTAIDVTLPHSMTSWSISALALNRDKPVCFMQEPLKLVTFQDIFLQVSMPYKVVQGEQIDLVATIFNYSPQEVDVLVYMLGVEDVCSEADPGERSEKRRVRIQKHASQALIFPIIPLKVGKYPIRISAITRQASSSDIVERELNVVPKGRPVSDEVTFSLDPTNRQRRSKRSIQTGNLLDEIDSSKGLQKSRVRLMPTRDSDFIVPETQECIVSAVGDNLGQTVQNSMRDVENLIRLPHGCGEQVMIYLGPTLYTTKYLSSINKLIGDLRWRAIRYIQTGYKRILNFRKDSGAFSAFPGREPSIWLTAFIAKMLCQTETTPHVANEIHVDKNVINMALNWIIKQQSEKTGNWIELNPVYHREMLGGVLRENALNAFVTITLNECSHHASDLVGIDEFLKVDSYNKPSNNTSVDQNHIQINSVDRLKVATQKAEQSLLLDRYRAVREKNPYVLALTAYALSFSRPREAAASLNDLILFAERNHSRNQLHWRGDHQIETAAYALQAIIELAPILQTTMQPINTKSGGLNPSQDALAIANWLASRRSYTGAFESTQDTVVALEALSKYAQLESSPSRSFLFSNTNSKMQSGLTCNVTINNRTRRSIEFDQTNSQIMQVFKLDSIDPNYAAGETLEIVTSGSGLGTMSVKLKYNVFYEEDELCPFNIDSSIEEWKNKISHTVNAADNKLALVDDTSKEELNRTIEDDYFKSFDQSMLSELNLVYSPDKDLEVPGNSSRPQKLRLKRTTIGSTSDDSWTSKLVNSLRSKLPSWLVPSKKSSNDEIGRSSAYDSISRSEPDLSSSQKRASNNSRRSTSGNHQPVPMIIRPTGIPVDAKINHLSENFDLGSNHSETKDQTMRQTKNVENKLVLLLRSCVYYLSSRRDSEMSVIEVGLLSGFKPNEADLKQIIEDPGTPAMKYEISADRSLVVIYMRYIPSAGPFCLQFRLVRDSLVYNLQSGYIRVYEYYSPTHSCANYYTPSRQTNLIDTSCDSSNQVCRCASTSSCPPTGKVIDLGQIEMVNVTSARSKLKDLVCSPKFDFVSRVQLVNVREVRAGKFFKINVRVLSDIRGNLSKIIDSQKNHNRRLAYNIRKPSSIISERIDSQSNENPDDMDTNPDSLDSFSVQIDSNCIRNDPHLLHFAHPNQWKQGGGHMILFAKYSMLEKKYHKTISPKPSGTNQVRGKPQEANKRRSQDLGSFEDSQSLQYSTNLMSGKDTILHDTQYRVEEDAVRKGIQKLISWLELRVKHDAWSCDSQKRS